ncbi:hypothetical protein D4R87_03375 [bacterium]|nr:MAG: hypothetical protein D4R87_03375 [bacterium]
MKKKITIFCTTLICVFLFLFCIDNFISSGKLTALFSSLKIPNITVNSANHESADNSVNADFHTAETLKKDSILLGTGKVDFTGSPEGRITNIQLGMSKINSIILPAGKEFSTLKTIGTVSSKKGYELADNIRNGKTVMALGGGLCQVSTSLFRAALNAGLKITQRKNHAYAINFYSPHGTDAAIASPSLDFKFINTTEHSILIQGEIIGTETVVKIFGINNRIIKIKGPDVVAQNKNGSFRTVLYQEIYNSNDELLEKNTFYSYYQPEANFH